MLKEFSIILCISLIGVFLSPFLYLPASIIALFILVILLLLKVVKPINIQNTSKFLLMYMPLFFIPVSVKIMVDYHFILPKLLPIILLCFITTFATFFVSGTVVKYLIRRKNHE